MQNSSSDIEQTESVKCWGVAVARMDMCSFKFWRRHFSAASKECTFWKVRMRRLFFNCKEQVKNVRTLGKACHIVPFKPSRRIIQCYTESMIGGPLCTIYYVRVVSSKCKWKSTCVLHAVSSFQWKKNRLSPTIMSQVARLRFGLKCLVIARSATAPKKNQLSAKLISPPVFLDIYFRKSNSWRRLCAHNRAFPEKECFPLDILDRHRLKLEIRAST